jgi:F-type H+-transporting ATPase subunit delta
VHALVEVARKRNQVNAVETDLRIMEKEFNNKRDKRFFTLMAHPLLEKKVKSHAITQFLFGKGTPLNSPVTARFINMLLKDSNEKLLIPIAKSYFELMAFERGEVNSTVTSAQQLTDPQKAKVEAKLNGMINDGEVLKLSYKVDSNIIGGLKFTLGSQAADLSTKTMIDNVRFQLKNLTIDTQSQEWADL